MKIRNGFVSNSSSASFIIRWKSYDMDDRPIDEIIADVMYPYLDLDRNPAYNKDKHLAHLEMAEKEISYLAFNTILFKHENGDYLQTTEDTTMYNDMESFSNTISKFVFALTLTQADDYERKAEIIECSIKGE